jgi:hypothetical protein
MFEDQRRIGRILLNDKFVRQKFDIGYHFFEILAWKGESQRVLLFVELFRIEHVDAVSSDINDARRYN